MNYKRFEYLFISYLEERCTPAEQEELFAMMSETKYDNALQTLLERFSQHYQADHQLDKQRARLIYETILSQDRVRSSPQIFPFRKWPGVAAALVLVAFLTGLLLYFQPVGKNKIEAANHVVQAGKQHQYVGLPDGSAVILHAGSKLMYSDEFNGATRIVSLIGEGYFDIAHDSARPFRVLAGTLTTTVLGTAFNIRAEPGEQYATITVKRGKVHVKDQQADLGILTADEQLTYNTVSRKQKQITVNANTVIGWRSQDLFFDNVTVGEAIRQLGYRFDIRVHFTDTSLQHCRFTGTFTEGETAEKILQVICSFNNAFYTMDGKEVTINGHGCE